MNSLTSAVFSFAASAIVFAVEADVVIAIPDSSMAIERSAAEELREGLERCTGKSLDIISECAAAGRTDVYFIGATREALGVTNAMRLAQWPYDGILIKSVPRGLVLTGHPTRGVFYAVDEYLERFCGVRWWTAAESHYPKLEAYPLKDVEVFHAPQFKYRETYYLDSFNALFKVRTKGNFSSITRYMLDPMEFVPSRFGGDHQFYCFPGRKSAYHSFFEILPPDEYFKGHPEWYSLIEGARTPSQLCLSNPEMTAVFTENVRKILADNPNCDFISISQNDRTRTYAAPPCECEECSAVRKEEGEHSGGLLRFVNKVAQTLEKDFPNVKFDTFAYTWSRAAPKKTSPRRNVTVRYCNIECPFSFPLDTPGNVECENFMKNLKAWSQIAAGNLYIWDYVAGFRNYMIPHPNMRSIARNIRIFADAGAVGVFEQGDALCPAGEFAALKYWLISHLLWNPAQDDRLLMEDFIEGYYGRSAAPKIKEYISTVNDYPFENKIPVRCYHYNVTNFLSAASVFAAERVMADALRLAADDGADFVRRVYREKLSIDQVFLLNWHEYRSWAASNGRSWPLDEEYGVAVEKWIAAAKGFGVKGVHESVTRGNFDVFCRKLREGRPDR